MFKRQTLYTWVEEYLFHPKTFTQKTLSIILLPLSGIYCLIVIFKRNTAQKIRFKVPIVSVGNLTVGGSGKTPLLIGLCKNKKDFAIVLRGYKRASKGLHVIAHEGKILCDVKTSGDEAMEYAKALRQACVIVSENRDIGIQKAIELGAKAIFLDDGFSKAHIEKFDILIKPQPQPRSNYCLPSGPYREPFSLYNKADMVLEENKDFTRFVSIIDPQDSMVLITGISKPQRLETYIDSRVIKKIYFEDHYMYTKKELKSLLKKSGAKSILTTQKDAVKMESFDLPLSILSLQVEIEEYIKQRVNTFLADFR